ncbi:hypothetical protein B0H11DRAFT_2264831 [Mycena galericulata]|nr:hypothetical protein B0H11DRAFT_2264831 [Mycena galericulata]
MALKPTFFCQAVFHRTPGKRDINKPLSFPVNDRILIYDSQGCEAGEEANIKTLFNSVLEFTLQTRYRGTFPIVVVFTKLDTLHEKWVDKLEHELGEEMEDKEFDDAVDAAVEAQVQELCVEPLRTLSPEIPLNWIATSISLELRFKTTITDLVQLTPNIEKIWIVRRSNVRANIDALINYSLPLIFFTLIISKKREFLALLSVLVEDISDEPRNNYSLTEKVVQSIINI